MRINKAWLVVISSLVLWTCSMEFPTYPVEPAAGQQPTEPLGTSVVATAKQVQWTVTDASGKPVPKQPVLFQVASGGGSVSLSPTAGVSVTVAADGYSVLSQTAGSQSVTQTTGDNGTATVYWTLGQNSTLSQQLDATAGGAKKSWTASVTPAPANKLTPSATALTGEAGQELAAPVQVRITDQYGNPVAQAGTSMGFKVTAGLGKVRQNFAGSSPFDSVAALTDATGAASVMWRLGTVVGAPNTLRVSAGSLTFADVSATAKQGQGIMAVNLGNGQSATVGTAVAVAPSVRILDVNDNALANVSVTFAVASGGGSITGATATTNGQGVATVGSWTLGTGAGQNTLTASAAGLTNSPITFTATGTADNAASMAASTTTSLSGTVGAQVSPKPGVVVKDKYGNVKSGVTVTFAVATGDGFVGSAPTKSGTAITDNAGVATVNSWILGPTAGSNNNTLTASVSQLTGSPVTFTASAAPGAGALSANSSVSLSATVGTAVSPVPSVKVLDSQGNPVPNVSVTFAVASGGGSLTGATATTLANGVATVGSWTLGTTAGVNTLTASASGVSGSPVTFSATGTAAAAASVASNSTSPQSGTVGQPANSRPSVMVKDQYGNVKSGVAVTFAVATGGGSVTGGSQTTGADGVATVGSWILGPAAGTNNNTLTATVSGVGSVTFTASAAVGAGTMTVQQGNGQTAVVGSTLVVSPAVVVRDALGNAVSGIAVTFTVASGIGSVSGATQTTDAMGVATVGAWTLGTTAGTQILQAEAAGVTGSPVTFSATATAGPARSIAVNGGDAQSATVGTPVSTAPSVIVKDQFGNAKSGVSVTFAVASGGGSATGLNATTNASGIATLGSWTLGTTVGSNSLTATSAGLTGSPVTFTASATVGAAASMTKNGGDTQSATVGTAVSTAPSVIVKDQYGNVRSGVTVAFSVATGGGSVTVAAVSTGADGIATVGSWTMGTTAGANTLTATAGSLNVTFSATGTAGAATQMAKYAGDNQTATVSTAVSTPPSVIVKDQYSNPVSGISVTFAVASGGGVATGTSATTNALGIAAVGSWTIGGVAGTNNNSLTATSAGLTGSPLTFTASGLVGTGAMTKNAGDGQSATVGTAVATAPSIVVRDASSNPVANVSVTFAVASGGGSITGATQTTDASGIATVGSWTLGTTAGTNTLTASTAGATGSPQTFTATGTAAAAASIALNAGDGQTTTAGTAVGTAPSVIVKDQYNNVKSGVSVTFAVASGGGSVTGGSATTNASGIATVGSWTLGSTAGTNTLTATSAGLTGSPVTFTATGAVGAAATIAVNAGNGQGATVGTAVATAPSVIVKDAGGNGVSGVSVTFAVASGGGSITGGSATTNASGVATVGSWTLGTTAGANTLTATSGSLSGSPVTFTATGTNAAAASIAANAGDGQSAAAGAAVSTAPSVIVKDQYNNPVSGVSVTFAVASGGGSVTGTSATTNGSGIATVGSWTLGASAGANTLTATSAGLTGSPVTFTATGTAAGPASMTKNGGDGQTATVNTAVATAPSVLVKDSNNNPVPSVTVTFAVASGGGLVTGGSATTNASGIATVGSWTLGTTAGANTLTASVSGAPSATFSATGTAGAATQIAKNAGDGQLGTVSTAVATLPSVIVKDQHLNPVSGVSVTFAVASGGGSATGLNATTNASGIATVGSWTLGAVSGFNNNTLTATSAGLSGSPLTFTASAAPGSGTISANAGNGQSATVGTAVAVAPSVRIVDGSNNALSGVSVTFAVASGGGSVTSATVSTDGSGIATVGSWTLGTTAGTNTMTASASGATGSPVTFTATGTAGAASQIAINAGNGQSATVATSVATAPSVIVRDTYGNVKSGVSVTFAVASGGGSGTGLSATTGADGIATVGSWTLGTTAGANTMSATSAGLTGSPLTFTATGTAGAASQIAISVGNAQSATVGTQVSTAPAVVVKDQYNNVKSGVSVTFAVASGGGSGTGLNATTGADGIATVGSWTLGTTAGANTLTATSAGLTGSPLTFTATGTAGAASQIAINAGNGQSATVGASVATAPSVIVRDQYGNVKSGVSVTFAVASGGGSGTGLNATTGADGIATVGSWTLGTTVGANTMSATSAGLTGSPLTFTATGTAGAAATIEINAGNAQSAAAGAMVATAPSVIVKDQYGNVKSGVSVTFAVASGGGSVTAGSATTGANGIATVGSWTLGAVAGANSLTAASAGLTGSPVTFTATGT